VAHPAPAQGCRLLEEIAVATSTHPADDAIADWCNSQGVIVVRGPEEDMLARYAWPPKNSMPTSSCGFPRTFPFLDAGYVDHLVATLIEQQGDYVLPEDGTDDALEGVDAFSPPGAGSSDDGCSPGFSGARACHRLFPSAPQFRESGARQGLCAGGGE
jgi:hypothetical protein